MKLLEEHRQKIDFIDDRIIDLLAERMDVIRAVAKLKAENDIPAVLPDRVEEVIARCAARAETRHVDPELARLLYTLIVDHACAAEEEIIAKK
jgi:chorismate mutase